MQHGTQQMVTAWRPFVHRLLQSAFVIITGALAACGGAGSSTSATVASVASGVSMQSCAGCGAAVVSLTDAPGDFLSYIVKVVSLQLTRADGTVVETVPVTTQVDFAKLVNLSEIISAKQVPAGQYVSASITIDYSGATVVVDNGTTGVTIAANQIINGATSTPLVAPNPTQMTLKLSLGAKSPLVVNSDSVATLALDFNLLASNAVTPSAANPTTVTVNPVFTASMVPDASKPIRVRGALVSVNNSGGAASYVVNVRPFNDADDTSGQVTVDVASATTFSINGVSYAEGAGIAQLATLATGTVTAALGAWDATGTTFTATSVTVGTGVAGTGHDSAEGTVVARTGNTLTLGNGDVMHADQDGMGFSHQVIATVGTATTVNEDGQSGTFTIADISVGQHLQLAGVLGTDSSGNTTLDATAGSARLMLTPLQGLVTVTGSTGVTLSLLSLDGRPASAFTFTGTGTSAAQDASAAAYTVVVPASLSTASATAGLPARFFGFVTPFGQAPPDFQAVTFVSYAQTRADLEIHWSASGETMPFTVSTSTELLIPQTVLQASTETSLRLGPQPLPAPGSSGLQLVPDAAATNAQFWIGHRASGTLDNFSTFADFVTALTSALNGTVAALEINADGPYNATTAVLSVDQLAVILNN